MCLAAIAHGVHPRYRAVVIANRDEFHLRPTLAAAPWSEAPWVVGGRDLQAGGSWLAVSAGPAAWRWALLTNVRDGRAEEGTRSRGELVRQCLLDPRPVPQVLEQLANEGRAWGGFNLLAAEGDGLWWLSNRNGSPLRALPAGLYGLSNAALDVPWPKVERTRLAVADWVARGDSSLAPLRAALADTCQPPDGLLPDTGVGLARERLLAPPFIDHPLYGTRASTVIAIAHDGAVTLSEHSYGPSAADLGTVHWHHPARLDLALGPRDRHGGWRRLSDVA